MKRSEEIKNWMVRNKKKVLIGSAVAFLSLVGTGLTVIISKDRKAPKLTFEEWLKIASKEELETAHEPLRIEFMKTGIPSYFKEQISHELGLRGAREWAEKHPPNLDSCFRWTDANRWEKD